MMTMNNTATLLNYLIRTAQERIVKLNKDMLYASDPEMIRWCKGAMAAYHGRILTYKNLLASCAPATTPSSDTAPSTDSTASVTG